jgi:hypothetical protein
VAGFYSARSSIMPPLPWPTFAPPLSVDDDIRNALDAVAVQNATENATKGADGTANQLAKGRKSE